MFGTKLFCLVFWRIYDGTIYLQFYLTFGRTNIKQSTYQIGWKKREIKPFLRPLRIAVKNCDFTRALSPFFSGPARTTGTCLESFCNLYPTWYFLKSTFEIQANRVPYFVMHSVHKGFSKKILKIFFGFFSRI